MPFQAAFFDSIDCIAKKTHDNGDPFNEWDGVTIGPSGLPSESPTQDISVYGDGSIYCINLTRQQVYDLYYSTSVKGNCTWNTSAITAHVEATSSGGTCYQYTTIPDNNCTAHNGQLWTSTYADTLPPASGNSINSNLSSFLTNEAYQVKGNCSYYPQYIPDEPNQPCDQDNVFPGIDYIKNTPDYLQIVIQITQKSTGVGFRSIKTVDGTFDGNQIPCTPFYYQEANILFWPKGKYNNDLGSNDYNPTGITFEEWSAKMVSQFGSEISSYLSDIWDNPTNYSVNKYFVNYLNKSFDYLHYYPPPEYEIKGASYAGALFTPIGNQVSQQTNTSTVYGYIQGAGNCGWLFRGLNGGGYHSGYTSTATGGYYPACVFIPPNPNLIGIDIIKVDDNNYWWNPQLSVAGYLSAGVEAHGNCPMPSRIQTGIVTCFNDRHRPQRTISIDYQDCSGDPIDVYCREDVSVSVATGGYNWLFNEGMPGDYTPIISYIPITYHQPYNEDIDPVRSKNITGNMFCLITATRGISGSIDQTQDHAPQATSHINLTWDFSALVPQKIDLYAFGWPDPTP